jgi:hypothetical protein
LNVFAANEVPPVLCAVAAVATSGGGGGLVSRARLACASTIARVVAFAATFCGSETWLAEAVR